MKNKPKALYIHIPFCAHLCDYCDFCKMQYMQNLADDYLIALKNELDSYHIEELETIYVGGGTPTSLTLSQLETLLKMIEPYNKNIIEYTFESNVETLDKDKLMLLKKYGVNRLSIGVESTNDDILKSINRHHSFKDVQNVMKLCHEIGFDNINLDLILGLPNSNLDILRTDLANLLSLNPTHISTYSLIINPHTVFYIKNIKEMNQDDARDEYDIVHETLINHGYIHYEVSNFAKPNYYSRHNFTYWLDKQYYGVGLGASGYIGNIRYQNSKSINNYLKGKTILEKEEVKPNDDLIYYLLLTLRTIKGIDLQEFKQKFGYDILIKANKTIKEYEKLNCLKITKDRVSPTYEGMMIMDKMIFDLLDEIEKNK